MKPNNPAIKLHSRVAPIFTRAFPHKLKYYNFLSRNSRLPILLVRTAPRHLGLRRCSIRASKSLVDEGAGFSDWVSGLESDPIQDEEIDPGRVRVAVVKRRRDGDSGGYEVSNGQVGGRKSGSGANLVGQDERRANNSGVKDSLRSRRAERGLNLGYDNAAERAGGQRLKKSRKSLGRGGVVASDEEIDNNDDEKGEEEEERKEEERPFKSFRDLISEEDIEEQVDNDSDGMLKNAGSLFAHKKELSPSAVPNSPGRSDSYLSETRLALHHSNYGDYLLF